MNIVGIYKLFPTEETCIEHLEKINGITSLPVR